MSWKEVTQMSQRKEFVNMALQENSNISELCRRFGISRKTGYKFIKRYLQEGEEGLKNHSRRPQKSPSKTSIQTERLILELREAHPAWGGRKLKRRLEDLGNKNIPSASTITAILQRNNCINPEESLKHKAWKRFRAEQPNDLWQMDFKGSFTLRDARCYPLTILDDHSRYSLGIKACTNQKKETVKNELITVFETYGLPYSILVDNGCPWGSDADHPHTRLTVWLMRLGLRVIHSRPFHPQTMGKDERFHRTLKTEVIAYCANKTMNGCQIEFDNWRDI
ncbi:MAG: IS481 family transposase, partial [Pseudomonadales bacterium]|nr:IS481 family transposase [Pseudomonadales bacterium]